MMMRELGLMVLVSLCSCRCAVDSPPAQFTAKLNERMEHASAVDQLVTHLQSTDEDVRDKALHELRLISLEDRDAVFLLRAATRDFPPMEEQSISATLVTRVAVTMKSSAISAVVPEVFMKLQPDARAPALSILLESPERSSAVAFMKLIREHRAELPDMGLLAIRGNPHDLDVYFPELFSFASNEGFGSEVVDLARVFCRDAKLPREMFAPQADAFVAAWRADKQWLLEKQQPRGTAWKWEREYDDRRSSALLTLEVFACLPSKSVEEELKQAFIFKDPRIVLAAIASSLSLQLPVPDSAILQVAASAETRGDLFDELKRRGQLNRFPRKFFTQTALAEAALVHSVLSEVGHEPDEIKLIKVVAADAFDFFVFRFTVEGSDGWVAGVAGPYERKEVPTTYAHAPAFTQFEPWASKTPEQHVGNISEMLERLRDRSFDGDE